MKAGIKKASLGERSSHRPASGLGCLLLDFSTLTRSGRTVITTRLLHLEGHRVADFLREVEFQRRAHNIARFHADLLSVLPNFIIGVCWNTKVNFR